MIKKIPKNIKAIIFDMDGVLVDSIPYHKEAWLSFLKKHNIILAPEDFLAQNHGNIDDMIHRFFGHDLPEAQVKALGQNREEMYSNLYKGKVKEIEGLTNFLTKMSEINMLASLATMGTAQNVDFILESLKIRRFFHSITNGFEVEIGKPNPEIYQLALDKLGLNNSDCIVIEDSTGGITAARGAGIDVIGVTTSHTEDELIANGCIAAISNFNELNL
jgi:HAD superfamily hydrolase (TIGR01509 family)